MVLEEVDDLVEPEGDESPPETCGKKDSVGSEAIAEISSHDLRQGIAPEERRQDSAHLGLRPRHFLPSREK